MAGKKELLVKILKSGWREFNHWRKKHWPFRLIIIILATTPLLWDYAFFGENVITMLVRSACRSIEYSAQTQLISAWQRYNITVEKKRLQLSLKKVEKRLSNKTVEELNKPAFKADLKVLFSAAKKHNIIPECVDLRQIKRAMLADAVYETEKRFSPEYRNVELMLDNVHATDYAQWKTWKIGVEKYWGCLVAVIFPEIPSTSLSWMLLCFFISSISYILCKKFRKIHSVLNCGIFTFSVFTISYLTRIGINDNTWANLVKAWLFINYYNVSVFVYLIYSSAVALFGCWFAEKYLYKIPGKFALSMLLYGLGTSVVIAAFYMTGTSYFFAGGYLIRFNNNLIVVCNDYVLYMILCSGAAVIGVTAYLQIANRLKK